MRNIFDQYSGLENRVTHALGHALVSQQSLLDEFVEFATGKHRGRCVLTIQEQVERSENGEISKFRKDATRPDIWIYGSQGFLCAVENKIFPNSLDDSQLDGHWTLVKDELNSQLVAISPDYAIPQQVVRAEERDLLIRAGNT